MTPWIVRHRPNPGAACRLFCLPYAGGGAAAFRLWPEGLPASVEVCPVQLPGREGRLREAPLERVADVIARLVDAIRPLLDRPVALFGHSLGALVAYELAHALRRTSAPVPMHLFVSGRRAPARPSPYAPIHELADAAFLEQVVARYDAIPRAVLADRDLMRLLLPALKADFALIETYQPSSMIPLECPITAFGGTDDVEASAADLEEWHDHTRDAFRVVMLPGGHFFVQERRAEVLVAIAGALRGTGPALG